MEEFYHSVSAREWASAFWLLVFAAFAARSPKVRESFRGVLRALFQPLLIVPMALAALYAAAEIWLLASTGWWSLANLKTTILWLITFGFVSMFEVISSAKDKKSLGKVAREIVSVTAVFIFVTELQSFPLAVELVAVPLVTLLGLIFVIAQYKPEHAILVKPVGCLTGLVVLAYAAYSLWLTVARWRQADTWATALEFLVPIILSLLFLPFLWAWQIYAAYSTAFASIAISGLNDRLKPYARRRAVFRFGVNIHKLDRWRQSLLVSRPRSKAELVSSLDAVGAQLAREASPPVVPPSEGWSPYIAITYMADAGFATGPYRPRFDDEWGASSAMVELAAAALWPSNLAFYIDGNEKAATALKFKLNVNDPASDAAVEEQFVAGCLLLLERAISLDAAERMQAAIRALRPFAFDFPYGRVSIIRDEFTGGITGGYSLLFLIRRGGEGDNDD